MKKWDEMTARERDALVGEKVMELKLVTDFPERYEGHYWSELTSMPLPIPNYTTEISAAWDVFQTVGNLLFSTRNRFMNVLRMIVDARQPIGNDVVPWVDLWWFVTPDDICKAALMAIGVIV